MTCTEYLGRTVKETYTDADVVRVPCPLCGVDDAARVYTERAALGIVRCRRCDLIYVSPRLKTPEQFYQGDAELHFEEARYIFEGRRAHHRDPNYLDDLRLIERFKPTGRFLDIGTNCGFFLRHTRGRGWTVTGLEPSASLSDLARTYFGLDVDTAFLEERKYPDAHFDVVTMTDVFEHIAEPRAMLREIRRILKPDGIVFVKVPNGLFNLFKLAMLRRLGREGAFDIFDSFEHVVHYGSRTLRAMLEAEGFVVRHETIAKPVQGPVWHEWLGRFYQYPTPWRMDWRRQSARSVLYWASRAEALARGGRAGSLAPNLVVVASPRGRA